MLAIIAEGAGGDGPPDRIDRPRLQSRLCGSGIARITVLIGRAGAGKSELLRTLRGDPGALYFRVGNEHGTFARFVHGLAQTIAAVAPGAQVSFPRAWERALQSLSPSTVLAHWMSEHLGGIDHHIVIDDLHDGSADPSIAAFIGKLAELRPKAPLTIAVRSVGALPIAFWMATRRMERPIDETDLRYNRAEIADAADRVGVTLDDRTIDALLAVTGGLPIAVAYALTQLRSDPHAFLTTQMPASFEGIAEVIFARRTERERAFLFDASLFPSADDELLGRSGWDDAPAIRIALDSDAAFMWETHERGCHFHDRFRDYLAQQFQSRDDQFRSTVAHRAVHSLRSAGQYADALEVATGQRLAGVAGELLDAHGFEILESGAIDVISEALTAFTDAQRSFGASALALRGYMEARWGRLDTAEAWFSLGLRNAQDEVSRVTIAIYYARELALRRREDACEVLETFADSTTLPRPILIDVRSSFAQALTAAGRLDEAFSRTDEVLELLDGDSPPALRARVFARAAYVALECGYPSLARERACVAAPLAVAQSLYDVAASTYSVLYNVAYDIDDDAVSCREYLDCMRDLGVKSGTLRFDLYVMLCMYLLHAEAGDETALTLLDRALSAADKHDAGTEIMETVLPAKALQAGWSGDFDAAQRLLRPTADRQATPARRALCWAQIGLYCAAGGDMERARDAFEKAQDPAAQGEDQTTQFGLTLLTLALGAVMSGDFDAARRWMGSADNAAIDAAPRLRALRSVIAAMIAGSADANRFAQGVCAALADLWTVSFGGMARLIEALPHPCALTDGGTETIGSLLARRELAQAALGGVPRQLAAYRRPVPAIVRLVDEIDTAIDTLFEHLDAAAPLMAEHSRAVSAWCSRLGRVLGLSETEITFVTRCGLIHDVGKTRTPTEILQAPRRLNSDEWAIMRDHAAEGARMIARQPLLSRFGPIVRGHHERLDGQGYPDGLRLGAIPMAARIVSVADCFNAMIGRRPYRLPMAPTEALNELECHRGTQFDPDVVEAMVRIVLGRLAETPPLEKD